MVPIHTRRNIPEIDLFVRLAAGPQVLKKAHTIERTITRPN